MAVKLQVNEVYLKNTRAKRRYLGPVRGKNHKHSYTIFWLNWPVCHGGVGKLGVLGNLGKSNFGSKTLAKKFCFRDTPSQSQCENFKNCCLFFVVQVEAGKLQAKCWPARAQ
jgi:hypothetical protein